MIVLMPTKHQAQAVANATGGQVLTTEDGAPTSRVQLPGDFERHRNAVEAVSVLFQLFDDDGAPVPSGWVLRGVTFEVEWPSDPTQCAKIRSHFGARRFAKNWALATVKADLDAKERDLAHRATPWTLAALRKRWNEVKGEVAPWWAENSKEAYASGIADLVVALKNWSASKHGRRRGRKVGFPRFESKHRARNRVRFTTGAMRLEEDRRHVTLPVIGQLRSKENTRRLERHVAKGNARVLSMTLAERWGRLFVSIQYAVRTRVTSPTGNPAVAKRDRAGVDLGLRSYATVADSTDEIVEFGNPAPLRATLAERRRVARRMSRRIPGSKGHRAARAKLARLDRRAVNVRREHVHQLTRWLVDHYHEVRIEDLDIAAMRRSMGRRAFRRAVGDAALGMVRPALSYKAMDAGVSVVVVDRFFPSSKVHHRCGGTLEGKTTLANILTCLDCGTSVDRDRNAALNLRDWPGHASPGPVGASAPFVPGPPHGGTGGGSDDRWTGCRARLRKTSDAPRPRPVRREPRPAASRPRNPARGAAG